MRAAGAAPVAIWSLGRGHERIRRSAPRPPLSTGRGRVVHADLCGELTARRQIGLQGKCLRALSARCSAFNPIVAGNSVNAGKIPRSP